MTMTRELWPVAPTETREEFATRYGDGHGLLPEQLVIVCRCEFAEDCTGWEVTSDDQADRYVDWWWTAEELAQARAFREARPDLHSAT